MVQVVRNKQEQESGSRPLSTETSGAEGNILGGSRMVRIVGKVTPVKTVDEIVLSNPNDLYTMTPESMAIADESVLRQIETIPTVHFELPRIRKIDLEIDPETGRNKEYTIMVEGRDEPVLLDRIGASPTRMMFVNGVPKVTVTRHFVPVQNRSVASKTYETLLMSNNPVKSMSVKSIGGKDSFMAQFRMSNDVLLEGASEHQLSAFGEDRFNVSVNVTNSYNMSHGLWAMVDMHRLACSNGMFWHINEWNRHVMHRAMNADQLLVLSRTADAIRDANSAIDRAFGSIRAMRTTPTSPEAVRNVMERSRIRQYEAEHIEAYSGLKLEFGRGSEDSPKISVKNMGNVQTQWDLVNCLTFAANHSRKDNRQFELQRSAMVQVENALRAGHGQAPFSV